jgi:hypothetical protein
MTKYTVDQGKAGYPAHTRFVVNSIQIQGAKILAMMRWRTRWKPIFRS